MNWLIAVIQKLKRNRIFSANITTLTLLEDGSYIFREYGRDKKLIRTSIPYKDLAIATAKEHSKSIEWNKENS
jgi:hypothetical protein